jgi:hypothetical protein
MKGFLGVSMVRHCLMGFALAQRSPLSARESSLGAFPGAAHLFAFSPSGQGLAE